MFDLTEVFRPEDISSSMTPPWELGAAELKLAQASFNIGSYLPARAAERPFQKALIQPEGYNPLGRRTYSHLNFGQLNALCDAYAHGLQARGVRQGDRVIMMVRQGLELIALTYALFKLGAVPVMIDPGMGRQSFLDCIRQAKPRVMIGIPLAHALRRVFSGAFGGVELFVTTHKRWWTFGAVDLKTLADFSAGAFSLAPTKRADLAAILFTSGSTGPPKGVCYTHGIFDGQVRAIGQMYGIEPGEVEVPAFPLFSLFSVALGMSVVIPDMDPTRPAQVNPHHIVEAILDHGATSAFGSPIVWDRVAHYCHEHHIKLPTLRRILTAGAPINPALLKLYTDILPEGVLLHTPYGATECLPVATISSAQILKETDALTRQGQGLCVGMPVEGMMVEIIEIDDEPIKTWADARGLSAGKIGEICVSGAVTTAAYDHAPEHNAQAKIPDPARGADAFWHRMGDVGYLDEQGRLWYCGRKSHRVQTAQGTMFTIAVEAIFNQHPKVFRSALVGLGDKGAQTPVIIIEARPEHRPKDAAAKAAFTQEILALAASHALTDSIKSVLFHDAFPVDRRHNAKIHRPELAQWAKTQR